MLFILQKFVRDRLFDQLITQHKGKLTSKIKDLRQRHTASLQLDDTLIIEYDGGWICPSSKQSETYFIERHKEICGCHLRCNICNHCIHNFVCTCIDNAIQWNMCKHIHLLCRSKYILKVDSLEAIGTNTCENALGLEKIVLAELTQKTASVQENLDEVRRNLLDSFEEIIDNADAEQLQFLTSNLKTLKSTVDILKKKDTVFLENDNKLEEDTHRKEPSNKQMEPQRRLFSTKKKTQRKKESISKPSSEEKNKISLNMLLKCNE